MRIPLGIFFVIFACTTCCSTNVFASNGCGVGKYKKTPDAACIQCEQKHYCPDDANNLRLCPTSHPNSNTSAESINDCYKVCGSRTFPNGQITADEEHVKYNSNKDCSYNTIDNINCNNNYGRNPTLTEIPSPLNDSICIAKISCSEILGNCNNNGIDGTISGETSWKSNNWDYSACKCTHENVRLYDDQLTYIGQVTQQCNYNSGTQENTQWETNCTTTDVSDCGAGYCKTSDEQNECSPAPAGYYSADSSTECQKCPIGSTTDGGAKNITDCYIKLNGTPDTETYAQNTNCGNSDATCFCDNNGCFTLPGTGKINANKQQNK